ncbi:MAG: hypothetical protein AVDCRST_MAG01-01-5215 [uncultured Rubrobacteraceae bacterium]|uniref:Glycerophosphoryl diester phosphodiesterase membrane domain-containing protein n=1 Tax=uncultured Rubrobacteraceae bacterium TaxID=349277 RepID=A0A6J4R3B9_9ACTN|nr:MAG: hypothetical protein AVDCRST_MAG01-01-5215 [uncultured Rubrobacteraceae bacterium]
MNYGDLIKDAFRISWRNKFLWFFAFFLSGAANSIVVPSTFGDLTPGAEDVAAGRPPAWVTNLGEFGENNAAPLIAGVLLAVLVLLLVIAFFFVLSRAAINESIAAIDRGEQRRFGLAWRAGLARFWRVLGLLVFLLVVSLVVTLVVCALAALLGVGVFFVTESVALRVLAVSLVVLLFLPLVVALSAFFLLLNQYALREAVVADRGVFASIEEAFRLLRQNVGRSLVLLLIQVAIAVTFGLIMLFATLAAGLLASGVVTALTTAELGAVALVVGIVLALLLSVPFVLVTCLAGAFHQAYWTLAYLRLTGHREDPGPAEASAVA